MSAVHQPPTSHALAAVVVASTTWTASLRLVYRALARPALGQSGDVDHARHDRRPGRHLDPRVLASVRRPRGKRSPAPVRRGLRRLIDVLASHPRILQAPPRARGRRRDAGCHRRLAAQDETDSEFECVGIVRSPDNERGSSNGAVTGDLDGLRKRSRPPGRTSSSWRTPTRIGADLQRRCLERAADLGRRSSAFLRACLRPRSGRLRVASLVSRAHPPQSARVSTVVKRLFDIVAASVLLVLTAPLLPVIALLVHRSVPAASSSGRRGSEREGGPSRS